MQNAGFPQPKMKIAAGIAFWPEGTFFYDGDSLQVSGYIVWNNRHVYAPTATELLPEGWQLRNEGDIFCCQNFYNRDEYFPHENPAEAAAQAWLYVYSKNSKSC